MFKVGDNVIYDRSWIAHGLKDNLSPPPAEGLVVRASPPFDSGHYNVDIQCEDGIEVWDIHTTNKVLRLKPTPENPFVLTAPAEYCYNLAAWQPGTGLTVDVNQGLRPAVVCARLGFDVLIEYEMPRGTSALQIFDLRGRGRYRSISYKQLPKKWIRAIEDGIGMVHLLKNPQ